METAEELAKYSVARKLLRELSSVTISGRDILRYLQAGSLMGCLTHLSLAGCKSVRDDAAWGHRPLLTSQFAALFLANPHLQYLDMSRTGLSNNGIFFFLLELSLCDPLVTPSGLKNLKQVVVGPPTDNMDRASLASNSGTYVPSISDALAELYFQSPALQLVALVLSSDTQSAAAHENQHSDQAINEAWRLLNEDNMSGLTTLATTVAQPCLVLRTRRGDGVPVQHHAQMVAFSKERMADDWLTRDKANMDMALDGDVNARLDTRYELGEVGDWGRHRSPQHRERSMWDGLSQSGKLPRRAQQQPRLQVQPCSGKADVPYDRQPGTGASDYLCPQDVRGRAACAQPRMKRREYVHSKAMRQKVRSDAQPRARHVAGPSRRAGLSTRQHMPLVQSTQRTKTPRAKTASSKRRSKLMLTRIASA